MIYIDDTDPEGVLEPAFAPRDVTIKRGVDANELYEILSEVGRGKFGTVYKCQEKSTGLKLAAKFVPIPKRDDRRNVEREVELMNSLQHHLIIQLYAAYEYQKMMCVVLELVEGGELFDRVIDDEFVLSERVCTVFIRQVCEAMQFIHRNQILHLDLKPENILCLTQEGNRIKIIDFGLARKFDPDKRLQILFGTPEFVAPEVVNFDCITYGTDMWSVGVICYVLISGLSPFMGETDIETMANVTIAKYDFEDESFANVSPEALDFIAKLLVKDCNVRMTATQCLEHKWLQRRPKPPVVSPKPLNVPPLKLKAATPSPATTPVPPEDDNEEKDKSLKKMDTTKDNLKNFIERWEEHPNSPYVFDGDGNVIVPLSETPYKMGHGPDSITSSRVCSPSPCESLDTITDDDDTTSNEGTRTISTPINELIFKASSAETLETATPDNVNTINDGMGGASVTTTPFRNFKGYLSSFDRRNSDTNCLLGRRSSGERINLADEIRKLSDHLLMLAEINTKLGNGSNGNDANNNNNKQQQQNDSKSPATTTLNTLNRTTSNSKSTTKSSTKSTSSSTKTKTKVSPLSVRLQQSIEETPKILANSDSAAAARTNKKPPQPTAKVSTKTPQNGIHSTSVMSSSSSSSSSSCFSTSYSSSITSPESTSSASSSSLDQIATKIKTPAAPAPPTHSSEASMRRMKFRINQMSRDVPIGLPNTHQSVNLEEAANTTKDCLLHLLEKYNETKMRNPLGRHQSISVDWNVTDNLEYRSMSSINAFFQRHNNTGQNVRQLQAQLERKKGTKAAAAAAASKPSNNDS